MDHAEMIKRIEDKGVQNSAGKRPIEKRTCLFCDSTRIGVKGAFANPDVCLVIFECRNCHQTWFYPFVDSEKERLEKLKHRENQYASWEEDYQFKTSYPSYEYEQDELEDKEFKDYDGCDEIIYPGKFDQFDSCENTISRHEGGGADPFGG